MVKSYSDYLRGEVVWVGSRRMDTLSPDSKIVSEIRVSSWSMRAAFGLLFFVGFAAAYLWATAGWLHIELLPVSVHVASRGWLAVFDWGLFDSSPFRIRPVSDFVEVFDAIVRPHTFWLFGLHPSVTASSVLMAAASAALFYGASRRFGLSRAEAAVLTAMLVSTIGFLSCFVSYIRPAKRLTILAVCAALYLIGRYRQWASAGIMLGLCVTLILAFCSDESAYVLWPISIMLLWSRLTWRGFATLTAMPIIFFVISKLALPPIYDHFGTSGPRDGVLGVSIVEKLLLSLASPDFYALAANDLARSTAISFGFLSPWPAIALISIAYIGLFASFKREWLVVAVTVSMIGASFCFSILDMANGPGNFLAQLTYYYHSALAPIAVFLVTVIYARWRPDLVFIRAALGFSAAAICVANLLNFQHINELTKILHTYPIVSLSPMQFDEEGLIERFERLLYGVPQANGYQSQFGYYKEHPMGNADYIRRLMKAFGQKT
jgi:hypothetical protein